MNQSRWCVTAVCALGALSCSDPVAPPGQGAFTVSVLSASPAVSGKSCPTGTAYTYEAPAVESVTEKLSATFYKHKLIDGESESTVSCKMKGSSSFTFSGVLRSGTRSLELWGGTMTPDFKGTAGVTIVDGVQGAQFTSAAGACTVDAVKGADGKFQAKPGSLYATFSCAAVERPPSDLCRTNGVFVLENCAQD